MHNMVTTKIFVHKICKHFILKILNIIQSNAGYYLSQIKIMYMKTKP